MTALHARFEREATASDGTKLCWLDYGRQDGEVIVLCHGLAAGADQFDADAHYFAGRGYRVLVPDLRGHGRSGRADPADPLAYSIARMARDLLEVFQAAGVSRVHFAGNSLGGILALHLVRQNESVFASLVTFGTAPRLALPAISSALIPAGYRILGKRLTGWLTAKGTTPGTHAQKMVARLVSGFDPRVGSAIARTIHRYDLFDNALAMGVPWLLIRGGRDKAVNKALDPLLPALEARPNIEIVRMDHAGHCANLDDPDAFRAVLETFWTKHAERSGPG